MARPRKFSDQHVENAAKSSGSSKMAAHNELYRRRALAILSLHLQRHPDARPSIAPLLDRPNRTLMAELGRIEDDRQLIYQAVWLARRLPTPVAPMLARLRALRLAGKVQTANGPVLWTTVDDRLRRSRTRPE